MTERFTFRARVIRGSGRGKKTNVPTINVDPSDAPAALSEGIYACFVTIDAQRYKAAVHYGPRPVFKDSLSFECHILDTTIGAIPEEIAIEVVGRLRDVQDFPNKEALLEAIQSDIAATRAMLGEP